MKLERDSSNWLSEYKKNAPPTMKEDTKVTTKEIDRFIELDDCVNNITGF